MSTAICLADSTDKCPDLAQPGYATAVRTIDLAVSIGYMLGAQVCPQDVITVVPTPAALILAELGAMLEWPSPNLVEWSPASP